MALSSEDSNKSGVWKALNTLLKTEPVLLKTLFV